MGDLASYIYQINISIHFQNYENIENHSFRIALPLRFNLINVNVQFKLYYFQIHIHISIQMIFSYFHFNVDFQINIALPILLFHF